MKYQRKMPEDSENSYPIVSPGEHKFQVVDIHKEDEDEITIKCEVVSDVSNGISIFYRLSNNQDDKFFWLTKIFLKCIDEPHNGNVVIDTGAWIGRQFFGEVKHTEGKDGKTYANIKKLIPRDIKQSKIYSVSEERVQPKEVAWDE